MVGPENDAVARIRRSYDDRPYVSVPIQRQHPARLAASARWRGLATAAPETARILEIGCAAAGHIIPLAQAMPGARFLGVDLSGVQIAQGRERIARLGLANITLSARSFMDIDAADGEFDFIICHGVFSWVPDAIRPDLLRIIGERLAPEGLAVVSFNVLPGWRLFQIARDSLLLHARLRNDPARRAEDARELFAVLAEQSRGVNSYGRFWRDEAKRLAAGGDAYIAHEMFEDANAPMSFGDFRDAALRAGLDYVGESVLSANNEDCVAPEGAQTIRALAGEDRAAREQYIDIFSGRTFREALLARADRVAGVRREAPMDRLDDFHFVPARGLAIKPVEGTQGAWFVGEGEEGLQFEDGAVVAALERMIARQPQSSRLEDIAPAGATDPGERARIAHALAGLTHFGQCTISTLPIACATTLADRPLAWRLPVIDAMHGEMTANIRHAAIRLTPFQRVVLPMLDGAHTRADLVGHAVEMARKGMMRIEGPGGPVNDPQALADRLSPEVDAALAGLLRFAMLLEA